MRSFLGAANVYRRFIRGCADIARPLQDMTKKDNGVRRDGPNEIVPTDEQREAFEALKSALVSPPVLALPVRGRPFMIDCDASEYAIGAVLLVLRAGSSSSARVHKRTAR